MVWGLFKPDSVSEAYKKMKAEELKGNQHKLDKNKNGKLDGDDFKKLRGEETEEAKEEAEQIDELSKGTLASYAKKATHDSRIQQKIAKDFEAQSNKSRKPDMKTAADRLRAHYQAKAFKRQDGTVKAIDRLAKEDYTEEDLDALISEVLSKDSSAGKWISDFVHSDNPKFAGKSKEKRKDMALAAYYAAQKKESIEYDSFIELDEEADLVKTGAKQIKHANVKDKEDDQDTMQPRAKGERDFLDQLSVQITDDPARDGHKTGADKLSAAAKPTGKGAGSYNGDSKLSSKDKASFKESAGEKDCSCDKDDTNEEAGCSSKGKKTYAKFKAEKANWKKGS